MDVVKNAIYFAEWEEKWRKILKSVESKMKSFDKKDKKHFILKLLHEEIFRFIVDIRCYHDGMRRCNYKCDCSCFRRNKELTLRRKYLNQKTKNK